MVHGGRKVAFPVRSFDGNLLRLTRPIPPDQGLAYWPSVNTPALSLLPGSFDSAKMLSITEGEWDVLTLCHASGWFDHDAAWLEDICAIGIRARRVEGLYRALFPSWPNPAPSCLLLPDRDEEGRGGFQMRVTLSTRCAAGVASSSPGVRGHDLNARHKAHPVSKAEVAEMLLGARLVDARGVVIREIG